MTTLTASAARRAWRGIRKTWQSSTVANMDAAIPMALKGNEERYAALTIDPKSVPSIWRHAEDQVLRRVSSSTTIPDMTAQSPPVPAEAL